MGYLDVWADDTAGVWLDDGTVAAGNGSSGTATVTTVPMVRRASSRFR